MYANLDIKNLEKFKSATIVTAIHFGANSLNNKYFYSDKAYTRSKEIVEKLSNRLNELGIEVRIKSSESVDEDLCFMGRSKFFVKGFSQMSEIICNCLDRKAAVWEPFEGRTFRKISWLSKIF